MKLLLVTLSLFFALTTYSKDNKKEEKENFTIIKEVEHTPPISQGRTGTCWCFSTTSFLESEIMRKGFPETNLSEMFSVYYNYYNKAFQYLLYQGHNNFGEGSVSHDVINVVREHGIMPYDAFPGIKKDSIYNHSKLIDKLVEKTNKINDEKSGKIDVSDLKCYKTTLKKELGKLPETFDFEGETLSPIQLRDKLQINTDDYIELTSFTHHPFYKQCVIEIPDNWSHALYYNLPIDELIEVMYYALNNNYSICWDGDISEKTFSHKKGKAYVPEKQQGQITQELRQKTYYNRTTTDDHLMHIVGLSKDSKGTSCFYTKNSWGTKSNAYGGYLHMTEDYVRLKTIAIMVNKDAIPQKIKEKLGL